jgi:hypothetical protein
MERLYEYEMDKVDHYCRANLCLSMTNDYVSTRYIEEAIEVDILL